ncbi:hypothetical protein [Filimonas effusa]|uniref:Uncharacterized protein n=1 Tax=Filimonas effusa TaxID=2508721 RepID=A0A4Q1DBV1_9BACT|nr:hypothetical protein [Filimonas effusa]RXK85999.1 hypothetical protein ESB13_04090 [Filimonas effusa]
MDARQIPDDVLNRMLSTVNSFFLNDPHKKWKKVLWEFYTSAVYNGEQVLTGEENSEILFKYECLQKFLSELNRLNKKMKNYEK